MVICTLIMDGDDGGGLWLRRWCLDGYGSGAELGGVLIGVYGRI